MSVPEDSVIVIEPEDVLPPGGPVPGDDDSDESEPVVTPASEASPPLAEPSSDAGWDDASHWHHAVRPAWTPADQAEDDDAEADDQAEVIQLVPVPEASYPANAVETDEIAEVDDPADLDDLAEVDGSVEVDSSVAVDESAEVDEPAAADGLVEADDPAEANAVAEADPVAEADSAGGPVVTPDGWREVLSDFVDNPVGSVEAAAALLDTEIATYIALLGQRQDTIAATWRDSAGTGTEDLRIAILAYRDLGRQVDALMNQLS
jgi:hypothetical protein